MTTHERLDLSQTLRPSGDYVYGYFKEPGTCRWDECFYIGKGVGTRWTQHVSARAGDRIDGPTTEKESHIDAWITAQQSSSPVPLRKVDLVRRAENRLVRIIDCWSGENSKACAFAAEYALIRGVYGAYQLTNLTGGNNRFQEVRLLAREAGLDPAQTAHAHAWAQAVSVFAQNPDEEILNTRIRPLMLLLANAPLLASLDARLREIGLTAAILQGFPAVDDSNVPAHFSVEGASDPCLTYVPQDSRPIRIQLKLSRSNAATFINIRPRDYTALERERFLQFMAEVSPNGQRLTQHYGGDSPIRNPGNPYFKPFATDGRGTADMLFPLRETDDPVQISPNWAPDAQPLSLTGALKLFLDAFISDA